ncbi:Fic family protein [Carboxylicivirga marina]|uniref:Fic family protein n=1 Tax=Carboxylicivirga marina TaxID=2800988 RepID=A0ABS1HHG3_9BACT|nr:Fic family protein [Carboxylicivirga marina]MBK3516997.1 Fic family protein [Carboxylicivirga marina]
MKKNHFSQTITVFQGRTAPEEGNIVGYAAIINTLELPVPLPNRLSLISTKNRRYEKDGWQVFTPKHQPEDSLYKHLVFALKYEGINLLCFKCLFNTMTNDEVIELLAIEPTGQYSRKIWFLYEWFTGTTLDMPNLGVKNFVPLLDDKLQFTIEGQRSSRHRIINNLPGTPEFCPLIYKTPKLQAHIEANLANSQNTYLQSIHKDVLQRASSFLLLKDSKASFTIEGENPGTKRALRWGKAIGQAGSKDLSLEELIRLQQLVIDSKRFTQMGLRQYGGFVGEHDRSTGEPLPDHISARHEDLEQLIDGLIATNKQLEASDFDAVLAATCIAFGFVFIHPFVDGNGRLHRYLIHHILAKMRFSQQGIIFPVSASILNHIDDYRLVLESYSHPVLDFIEWETTEDNNVQVINETIDYYRYFDATAQAEFLYDCVLDTINNVIPEEVNYLKHYDDFKRYIDNQLEMPDKLIATLVRFLEQNNGRLSKRARSKEFKELTETEIKDLETQYQEIFMSND